MKLDKIGAMFIDGAMNRLSAYSSTWIISFFSLLASFLSFIFVYLLSNVFAEEYTEQLFRFSIVIPLLTTPLLVGILIRYSKHLKHFKTDLEKEIDKNKKKDVMLFEQARFVLMGEMMANISHQWKQPLNTINLAIIYSKTSNPGKEAQEQYFDIMEDNVNYLASTIDDFMSFFDKKTHLEIRELESIVKEIRSIIQTHIENRDVKLDIEIYNSYGDIKIASSISQIILNLLNNAKDAFDKDAESKEINLKFISTIDGLQIILR